jgi:hypothetical protein
MLQSMSNKPEIQSNNGNTEYTGPTFNTDGLSEPQISTMKELVNIIGKEINPQILVDLYSQTDQPLYLTLALDEFPMYLGAINSQRESKNGFNPTDYLTHPIFQMHMIYLSGLPTVKPDILIGELKRIFIFFTDHPEYDADFRKLTLSDYTHAEWSRDIENAQNLGQVQYGSKDTTIDAQRHIDATYDRSRHTYDMLYYFRNSPQIKENIIKTCFTLDQTNKKPQS